MASVVSMAFDFKYVKEFSVFASKFDRISMFGIKLPQCKEFNVLGMTTFGTLAAHAIKVDCEKFSMAYNWFGHLHDSCFDVEYGLCDIQGNTFNSLAGKPFISMKPGKHKGNSATAITGLVFRENKFPSEPVLPFGSLAMPYYSLLSPSSYLDIDKNQFPCSCQKLGWFLAFGMFGLNSHSLVEVGNTEEKGTSTFITQLYRTAGVCIECNHKECIDTDSSLEQYAEVALLDDEDGDGLSCGRKGLVVRNYDNTSDKQIKRTDYKDRIENLDVVHAAKEIYTNKADNGGERSDVYGPTFDQKGEFATEAPHPIREEAASDKNDKNYDSGESFEEKERLVGMPGDISKASVSQHHKFIGLFTMLLVCAC